MQKYLVFTPLESQRSFVTGRGFLTGFTAVFLAGLMMVSSGYCKDQPDMPEIMTLEGTVTAVDLAGSKITVSGVEEITFPITSSTQLKNDIYETQLSAIKAGDYVNVEYYRDASGAVKTVRIEVNFTKKDANKGWDDNGLYDSGNEW